MNRRELSKAILATAAGMTVSAYPSSSFALPTKTSIQKLSASLEGPVVLAGDELYEQARRVASHNPTTDKHPAVIVGCTSVEDVAASIRFAREQALPLAIQGGGHDVLGQSTVQEGMLLHTGYMNSISLDDECVRVECGVRAGQLNQALQPKGLAVPLGCHPNVGVTGLTLGGGLGWLLGSHGVTCDSVKSFEIVTADGNFLSVSEYSHPDLFWALRGGGGNFGVVTAIEYRHSPLSSVARGFIVYPGDNLGEFMRMFDDFMKQLPRELVVELVLTTGPNPLINVTFCCSSPESFSESSIEQLLKFGSPIAKHIDVVPYSQLTEVPAEVVSRVFGDEQQVDVSNEPVEWFNFWRGGSNSGWSHDAVQALQGSFRSAPDNASIGIGHFMHGRACDIDPSASPLIRQSGQFSYFFNANWSNPSENTRNMDWVVNSHNAQRKYSVPTYINYLSESGIDKVAQSYGSHFAELQAVKRRYDEENVFRFNRNIIP